MVRKISPLILHMKKRRVCDDPHALLRPGRQNPMPDGNVTTSADEQEFMEKPRLTGRCREEISETSCFLTGLPGDRFEPWSNT
jgi:hypothetical protein